MLYLLFDKCFPYSVADCAVSEWGSWSPCDNQCGVGTQTRTRVIVKPEQNGGKHCPQLEQSRTCRGYAGCHQHDESPSHKGLFHCTDIERDEKTKKKGNVEIKTG
uniref:Spondin-like TSP1 domain-containing protein n=1 Tax=Bracon brevicornis TaxID=1563983 RepID=A0A6V7JMV2_9HYME